MRDESEGGLTLLENSGETSGTEWPMGALVPTKSGTSGRLLSEIYEIEPLTCSVV